MEDGLRSSTGRRRRTTIARRRISRRRIRVRAVRAVNCEVGQWSARKDVRGPLVVDVDEDTGVLGRVCTGEGHRGVRCAAPAPPNVDLGARGVELGAVLVLAVMEGDDLVPDEVPAGRDVGRKGQVDRLVHFGELLAY